jgi:hypothetical protein
MVDDAVLRHHTDIEYEVFTIDGAFDEDDLGEMLKFVEEREERRDTRSFTASPFKNGKVLDEEFARFIYSRLKRFLPTEFEDRNGVHWSMVGPGRNVFFASMVPGDRFGLHTDTGSEYNVVTSEASKFTVLVYLTEEFEGGRTSFYTDAFVPTCSIEPKRGRTLAFDIDRYHMGEPVSSGKKKWIGIECVCRIIP